MFSFTMALKKADNKLKMADQYSDFLKILRTAVNSKAGESAVPAFSADDWPEEKIRKVLKMAVTHHILPLMVQTIYPILKDTGSYWEKNAFNETVAQAHRTAEFLSVYNCLLDQGLRSAVMKGVVLRDLYPYPEQRPSVDEDLLIDPADGPRFHEALLSMDFVPDHQDADPEKDAEITYFSKERRLCLEIHRYPFPPDSAAYGECCRFFRDAMQRTDTVNIYGTDVLTMSPTDHMLYMIFHGYKHFLHSGVGIRQICDMGLFLRAYHADIDWPYILKCCEEVSVDLFAATLFLIGEKYLGFEMPEVFSKYKTDETDLLEDIMSGGLYGTEDIDRVHSSTITLNTTAAARKNRKKEGIKRTVKGKEHVKRTKLLRTIFPPRSSLESRYSYLKKHPVLLPVAWTQRVLGYLKSKNHPAPVKTIQIGRGRVKLLKEYGIID